MKQIQIKSFVFVVLVLLSLSCMTPQQKAPPVFSRLVAQVGEIKIKEDELRFRMRLEMEKYPPEYFQQDKGAKNEKKILKQILDQLIEDALILAYAKRHGVEVPQEDIQAHLENAQNKWNPKAFENFLVERKISFSRWQELMIHDAQVNSILNTLLFKKIDIPLKDIQSYYYRNSKEFYSPEKVRVRQIVTNSLEKAQDLHERLLKGENFAKLAINHSQSPDRLRGGDVGYFAKGSFPKVFDEVCFKLRKGQVSEIVKSEYGYHIFKLLDKKPAGKQPLKDVAVQIQQKLFEESLAKAYKEWMEQVRPLFEVKVNQQVLSDFAL